MISSNDKVAFLDLVTMHRQLESELTEVFQTALRTAGFIGGPMVENFEREFAQFSIRPIASASPAVQTL